MANKYVENLLEVKGSINQFNTAINRSLRQGRLSNNVVGTLVERIDDDILEVMLSANRYSEIANATTGAEQQIIGQKAKALSELSWAMLADRYPEITTKDVSIRENGKIVELTPLQSPQRSAN